jgi:hypothetical protein
MFVLGTSSMYYVNKKGDLELEREHNVRNL